MPYSGGTSVELMCDKCENRNVFPPQQFKPGYYPVNGSPFISYNGLLSKLKKEGWKITDTGCICPKCAKGKVNDGSLR